MISPALMANIAKLLQNPKVLQSLMSAGLVASEAVKGKKNKGARAGLMISNALLGMFDEDGPFKDPLKGTIFSDPSESIEGVEGVEGIANRTQENFAGVKDMMIGPPTDYRKEQANRYNGLFGSFV